MSASAQTRSITSIEGIITLLVPQHLDHGLREQDSAVGLHSQLGECLHRCAMLLNAERRHRKPGLQLQQMLVSGSLPRRVLRPERRTDPKLAGHIAEQGIRRWLPYGERDTRVAEGTELDGESKPVVRTALLPDAREITLALAVVADPFVFGTGRCEEDGSLKCGEESAAGHGLSFVPGISTGFRG